MIINIKGKKMGRPIDREDGPINRLLKNIPTEIVAVYIAAAPFAESKAWLLWVLFAFCLILCSKRYFLATNRFDDNLFNYLDHDHGRAICHLLARSDDVRVDAADCFHRYHFAPLGKIMCQVNSKISKNFTN